MIKLWGILKGLLIQDTTDRTKQLSVEVDPTATTATRTTLKSAQTADRTLNLPDADDTLVGRQTTDTLTNKTIDGDDNTLQDIDLPSLKTQAADAGKFLLRDGLGGVVSGNAVPGGTVVGDTDAQTLENKTIDGTDATGNNTVLNDASDVTLNPATSSLTATDAQAGFEEVAGRLDTAESSKLDGPGTHADNILVKTDGVDTNNVQATGIAIDDSNNVTGVNDLTVGGNLTVNGTTTTLNTATLDVEDTNITVNNNGNDASSEGAGLTVERTGIDGSLVYEDALASKFKLGTLGSEVEVADVSSSQALTNKDLADSSNNLDTASTDSFTRNTGNQQVVTIPDTATPDNFVLEDFQQQLTNKDIDGGTASDNNRITLPSNTTANLAALTRKEGTIAYDTDLDSLVLDDGSAFNPIQSGSGQGGINYITNPDAENNATTGWNTYDDASGSAPIDGTGGSPGAFSLSPINLSDLRGDYFFRASVSAGFGDPQGEGFSTDFEIDTADTESKLQVSFDYKLISDYESGFLKVFVYDIDNATLLGSVTNDEDGDIQAHGDPSRRFVGEFQTTDSKNYRLIFHFAVSTLNGFFFDFDNVRVGPINLIPATYERSEIIDLTGSGDYTGGTISVRRVGNQVTIQSETALTHASLSTATSAAGVIPDWAIPEVNRFNVCVTDTSLIYRCEVFSNGTFRSNYRNYSGTLQTQTTDNSFSSLSYSVPNTPVVISNNELTQRTVRVEMHLNSDQTVTSTAATDIGFDDSLFDTHNGFDSANNRFVIPKDGYYQVNLGVNYASVVTDERVTVSIRQNGVGVAGLLTRSGPTDGPVSVDKILFCEKGDLITATIDSTADADYIVRGSESLTYMTIASLPDFSSYGVLNPNSEYLEVALESRPTTSTANTYVDSTESLTLTPGTWEIGYSVLLRMNNGTGGSIAGTTNVRVYDDTNSAAVSLTGSTLYHSLANNEEIAVMLSNKTEITITENTDYIVQVATGNTNVAVILEDSDFTGGITGSETSPKLWARRIK